MNVFSGHLATVFLAIFTSGCSLSPSVSEVSGNYVFENDPPAAAIRKALESGKAFTLEEHVLDGAQGPEKEAERERLLKFLSEAREAFPEGTSFAFVNGQEWRIGATRLSEEAIFTPMKGESADNPSVFRLPTRCKHQAYLIYSARDQKGVEQGVHVLAWDVDGQWRIAHIAVSILKSGAMDFQRAFAAAQEEEKAGREIMALGLYAAAAKLAWAPPYRQPPQKKTLESIYGALSKRLDASGKPLASLKTEEGIVEITGVNCVLREQGPWLALVRHVPKVADPPQMEAAGRAILLAFWKAHPDVKRHFGGIVLFSDVGEGPDRGKGYLFGASIEALESGFASEDKADQDTPPAKE